MKREKNTKPIPPKDWGRLDEIDETVSKLVAQDAYVEEDLNNIDIRLSEIEDRIKVLEGVLGAPKGS